MDNLSDREVYEITRGALKNLSREELEIYAAITSLTLSFTFGAMAERGQAVMHVPSVGSEELKRKIESISLLVMQKITGDIEELTKKKAEQN